MAESRAFSESISNREIFLSDLLTGLSNGKQKYIPFKYLYDKRGILLYDAICKSEDYYLSRTEDEILKEAVPVITRILGDCIDIVEYGPGIAMKGRQVIEVIKSPRSYCLVDLCEDVLMVSSQVIQSDYPELEVVPLVKDFCTEFSVSSSFMANTGYKKLAIMLGSTFNNLEPIEALQFLNNARSIVNKGDGLLIGVDTIKPITRLMSAYNDRQGLTREFNKNLLLRIANQYSTNIDADKFAHHAIYRPEKKRIEMHLVSTIDQEVMIEGKIVHFRKKESVRTENSYKYTYSLFNKLVSQTNFEITDCFNDDNNLYSIYYLTAR